MLYMAGGEILSEIDVKLHDCLVLGSLGAATCVLRRQYSPVAWSNDSLHFSDDIVILFLI